MRTFLLLAKCLMFGLFSGLIYVILLTATAWIIGIILPTWAANVAIFAVGITGLVLLAWFNITIAQQVAVREYERKLYSHLRSQYGEELRTASRQLNDGR